MALTTSNHALAPAARVVTPMHVAVAPRAPVHPPVHSVLGPDVKLVLHSAVPAHAEPYETLAVMPNETIQDIRLRLSNRGWFSGKSCLVFGDRELADAVKVSDLVAASGRAHPSYLHVFVKLSDVESVNIKTMLRELSLSNPMTAPIKSAVSHLLALPAISEPLQAAVPDSTPAADSSSASVNSSSRCSLFAEAAAGAADSTSSSSSSSDGQHGRAVIHLMVNKRARVNWHHLQENKFELSISSSETVDSLMRKIEAANGIALEPEAILIDGTPLSIGQPLAAYGISKGSVLELTPLEPEAACDALPDGSPSLASPAHQLHQHWQEARAGLAEGIAPKLVAAGTGGSYFLQNTRGNPVAVFKPEDEEPLAVNNPKGRTPGSSSGSAGHGSSGGSSEGLRRGTRPGEGAVREVAAYVLDHEHFAGVPPTALVSAYVSTAEGSGGAIKVGSLQQFVQAEGDCEERGYSSFPVQEVHKIAVLDLRLANADRNGGNILCERTADGSSWRLVPIDHGYILPASFEDLSFEWMYWQQAEQPFDQRTLEYIAALDADKDLATLQAHGISLRPECERVFRVCTRVLQKGAKAGLTASQLATICCREGLTKSPLEKLHSNALHLTRTVCGSASNLRVYMQQMDLLLDEYLEDFLLEGLI